MLLLITKAMPSLMGFALDPDPCHIGRLVQPREFSNLKGLVESGLPWAADNDAFQGFKREPFVKMLKALEGVPGCLFVAAPDVVADSARTITYFEEWAPIIRAHGLPVALVAQDGLEQPPWADFDALFIGGSTVWKLGADARRLVAEARARGKWVHMGRVNSVRRLQYARSIDCDSVDGSGWARFSDAMLPKGLSELSGPPQLGLL